MPKWDVHFDTFVRTDAPAIVALVERAKALASVIRGIPIPPHVQLRLDHLNIQRVVRGTTGIEGTEVSEEEVAEVLRAQQGQRVLPESRQREEQEVLNAATLMYAVAKIPGNPEGRLHEELVREFHKTITEDIDYPRNIPGSYRDHRVVAGDYVPPENGEEVRRLMAEFIQWFNEGRTREWDPIVRAIVAHFYVISIHLFGDGNGRTSRAVESYLLYQAGVNARGFYSLANYYYKNRSTYVQELDNARFRTDPDLTPFVRFALMGLVEELEAVHGEVISEIQIISFRDYAREILMNTNKLGTPVGERQFMFLLGLGREPISLRTLRAGGDPLSELYSDVTTKTLMRDIHFLEEQELIVVSDGWLRADLEVMGQFTA